MRSTPPSIDRSASASDEFEGESSVVPFSKASLSKPTPPECEFDHDREIGVANPRCGNSTIVVRVGTISDDRSTGTPIIPTRRIIDETSLHHARRHDHRVHRFGMCLPHHPHGLLPRRRPRQIGRGRGWFKPRGPDHLVGRCTRSTA